MVTFSINKGSTLYMYRVNACINANISYFKKFNGAEWEEAVSKTFLTAVQHEKEGYDCLDPYIKKLARTVLKVRDKEYYYDTQDESGEVAYQFRSLVTTPDYTIVDREDMWTTFSELYLLHKEDFIKVRKLLGTDGVKISKSASIKNKDMWDKLQRLMKDYGTTNVCALLYDFYSNLDILTRSARRDSVRVIKLQSKDFDYKAYLSDFPLIKSKDGKYYDIDKTTLRMARDPDVFDWDCLIENSCDIYRLDISGVINYLYTKICVPEGVTNDLIEWCGSVNKKVTPGGKNLINCEVDRYMSIAKKELISNIVYNKVNTIVAISEDYLYIKPIRAFSISSVRFIFWNGKVIDSKLEIFKKAGK